MPGFKRHPKLDEKIHCVAIVQDATIVDAMQDLSPEVTKNIKDMQTVMNSVGRNYTYIINVLGVYVV